MKRCNHLNVTLLECLDATSSWYFTDGELSDDGASNAFLNGRIEVSCRDCGYFKCFGRRGKRPRWIERLLLKVENRNCPEGGE